MDDNMDNAITINRDELLIEFQQATQLDFEVSVSILESCGWNREVAFATAADILGNVVQPQETMAQAGHQIPAPWQTDPSQPLVIEDEDEGEDDGSHAGQINIKTSYYENLSDSNENSTEKDIKMFIMWKEETFELNMCPTDNIKMVKDKLQEVTGVAVRNQILYSDYMQNPANRTTLESLELPSPVHVMLLEDENVNPIPLAEETLSPLLTDPFTAVNQFHHETDLLAHFGANPPRLFGPFADRMSPNAILNDNDTLPATGSINQRKPLISSGTGTITQATTMFCQGFAERYGGESPPFFQGTLHEAIGEARSKGRLLLVYIHNDSSIETNVFCKSTLSSNEVVDILRSSYIVWGWDTTLPINRRRLQEMVEYSPELGITLMRKAPVAAIFLPTNDSIQPLRVAKFSYKDDFVMLLIELQGSYAQELQEHVNNSQIRQYESVQREYEKDEQDRAYLESLEADRRKDLEHQEEVRKREEEERIREEIEKRERKEKERERELTEAKIRHAESQKQELAAILADEPPIDCKDKISRIRFRLPNRQHMDRRFRLDNTTVK
eukprot:Ihof_evm3s94 gene=Ihof_evmTU3s94